MKCLGLVERAMHWSRSHAYQNYWENGCKLQLSSLRHCNLVQIECLQTYSCTSQSKHTLLKEDEAEL